MKPSASFVQFVRSCGIKLTPAQAVLAAVGCDGVQPCELEGDARELARVMFGDVDVISPEARRTLLIIKGARIGGSRIFGGVRLLHLALTVSLAGLAPGESAFGVIVGPDMRLARQTLRFARGAAEHEPAIRSRVSNVSANSFTVTRPGGRSVQIEALPATAGGSAVRGRSLVGAVLSEAAFFRDADSVINDVDVYKGIAPRVLEGGAITIETTPWAQAGLAWDLFSANHGSPVTCIAAHCPTLVMRTDATTRAIVAAEQARDSENTRREFGGEFLAAGSGLFFDAETVDAAIDRDRPEALPPGPGMRVAVGADFAFDRDSSAIVVVAREGDVYHLADLLELRPSKGAPLVPSETSATFAKLAKHYGASMIAADSHYKRAVQETLGEHRVQLLPAPEGQQGKAETYVLARQLLREGRVRLGPNHGRLIAQLKAVVSRPQPGGGISISSPRRGASGHGDLVSALVLALWMAHRRGYVGEWSRSAREGTREAQPPVESMASQLGMITPAGWNDDGHWIPARMKRTQF